MKKNNRKGFTLAELLIVVAIIAVLVAIAIPVFTAQLEKARESTDAANLRSAYAEMMAAALSEDETSMTKTVTQKQTVEEWQSSPEFAENFDVAEPTTADSDWTLEYTFDDDGLVNGIQATK